VYEPNFANGDYTEGVVSESANEVVFEFRTPFIIAATPPNAEPWGIYDAGCTNGLVVSWDAKCSVAVSTDAGATWQYRDGSLGGRVDLTDFVKGHSQYLLKFGSGAEGLRDAKVTIMTVCQANPSMMPRLTDDGCEVSFGASGNAIVSAGPTVPHAKRFLVDGAFDSPKVTLELATPRKEPAVEVFAAAHVASGSPPDPSIKYAIDCSTDGGTTWQPIVADWSIERRGDNPPDFWSQSLCYGSVKLKKPATGPVRIRFHNDGGRKYLRCEAHLVYRVPRNDATKVAFAWTEDGARQTASHEFAGSGEVATWSVPTGKGVKMRWVEFSPVR
jgi:hypothetical protein